MKIYSDFSKDYFNNFFKLFNFDKSFYNKLNQICKKINLAKKNKKKILIFGNGGSSSIASHFSIDVNKNSGVRCLSITDPTMITCLSNDYKFEKWISKSLEFYYDKDDIIILISSSGKSKNMLNAAKTAKSLGCKNIITLTGFSNSNPLKKKGHINIWVDSKNYNFVENIHQILLLSISDFFKEKKL